MVFRNLDITNNLVANGVYSLPFRSTPGNLVRSILANVTISPIVSARSGVPFTCLVPGLQNGTIGHYANARPWHEGRNDGRGPDFVSEDLRISKTLTRENSRQSLELIAQSQNTAFGDRDPGERALQRERIHTKIYFAAK